MSPSSENPVQNKVIAKVINDKITRDFYLVSETLPKIYGGGIKGLDKNIVGGKDTGFMYMNNGNNLAAFETNITNGRFKAITFSEKLKRFVAIQYSQADANVYVSDNGENWTKTGTVYTTLGARACNVCYNENMGLFLLPSHTNEVTEQVGSSYVGNYDAIAYSADGTTWNYAKWSGIPLKGPGSEGWRDSDALSPTAICKLSSSETEAKYVMWGTQSGSGIENPTSKRVLAALVTITKNGNSFSFTFENYGFISSYPGHETATMKYSPDVFWTAFEFNGKVYGGANAPAAFVTVDPDTNNVNLLLDQIVRGYCIDNDCVYLAANNGCVYKLNIDNSVDLVVNLKELGLIDEPEAIIKQDDGTLLVFGLKGSIGSVCQVIDNENSTSAIKIDTKFYKERTLCKRDYSDNLAAIAALPSTATVQDIINALK